ncbi:MAG TPA: CPBP family intramembrane glutamic endopeptidase [Terriglobales bacterium]|jgi:membrane protease YdiL (CAAX protease family)|nr:CPBP family intramembrane glutamic endopeptidase [Terriglobales bacterium]
MAAESKNLIPRIAADRGILSPQRSQPAASAGTSAVGLAFQVGLVFTLILVAVWTPPGHVNTVSNLLAGLCILWLTVRSRYSVRQLGLARPGSGAVATVICGAFLMFAIVVGGSAIHNLGPAQRVPWERIWKYALWALEQQFILQSFFYVRLESLLGSRRAVWGAALLFCLAHLPSPVLTLMSFIGGLLFCEMFRRYRNIFPLGLVHAALGLTIAASLPDSLLHHMRVGIGYLLYRP